MNYRHGFHAGNFADVFKHALLVRLLLYLTRKDAPIRVIDTHAGEGIYDLSSEEAERTGEWRDGVGRLRDLDGGTAAVRDLLAPYLDLLGPRDAGGRPQRYPGSPAIATSLLREQDRAIFCELHPEAFERLRANFCRDARVKTIHLDGYVGLGGFAPPRERRGLVLIDPPFEKTDEYQRMAGAFLTAHRKWPTGVYALWHPIKNLEATTQFYERLRESGVRRVLRLELAVGGDAPGLRRTGLVIVNPPYGFLEEARLILADFAPRLAQGRGAGYVVEEITGE